ncbi:hypothetical protein TNCV_3554111 [Trichonephila clavipes]|nr:hypothetical protein TNCV_3554111 [Trichonephila clavipes]
MVRVVLRHGPNGQGRLKAWANWARAQGYTIGGALFCSRFRLNKIMIQIILMVIRNGRTYSPKNRFSNCMPTGISCKIVLLSRPNSINNPSTHLFEMRLMVGPVPLTWLVLSWPCIKIP